MTFLNEIGNILPDNEHIEDSLEARDHWTGSYLWQMTGKHNNMELWCESKYNKLALYNGRKIEVSNTDFVRLGDYIGCSGHPKLYKAVPCL